MTRELNIRRFCFAERAVDIDVLIAQRILEATLSHALALLRDKRAPERAKRAKAILDQPVDVSAYVAWWNGGVLELLRQAGVNVEEEEQKKQAPQAGKCPIL